MRCTSVLPHICVSFAVCAAAARTAPHHSQTASFTSTHTRHTQGPASFTNRIIHKYTHKTHTRPRIIHKPHHSQVRVKRDLQTSQTRQQIWQKRPTRAAKETYAQGKRDLRVRQERPRHGANETKIRKIPCVGTASTSRASSTCARICPHNACMCAVCECVRVRVCARAQVHTRARSLFLFLYSSFARVHAHGRSAFRLAFLSRMIRRFSFA